MYKEFAHTLHSPPIRLISCITITQYQNKKLMTVQFTELIQISSLTYVLMNVCVHLCVSLYVCSCM